MAGRPRFGKAKTGLLIVPRFDHSGLCCFAIVYQNDLKRTLRR